MFGRREDGIEHPVDAIPNDQPPFERFEMNIARSLSDRLKEHGVDQSNDGSFVCGIEEVLRFILTRVQFDPGFHWLRYPP